MNPIDRLRHDIADLIDSYTEGSYRGPGLLAQLANAHNRSLRSNQTSGARRGIPGSRPPAALDHADLIRRIEYGAIGWAYAYGGTHIRSAAKALRWLPDAAAAAAGQDDRDPRLTGRHGLISTVSGWVGQARYLLGFTEPAHHYPTAICPDCDEAGHIHGRPANSTAWCQLCGARISALGYAALLADEHDQVTS